MSDAFRHMRARAMINMVLALFVAVFSYRLFGGWGCLFAAVAVGFGLYWATRQFIRLVRLSQIENDQLRGFQAIFQQQYERANLPRRVFLLLLAVAEADGQPSDKERALVRQFVLQRFTSPIDVQDLMQWEENIRVPPEQVGSIALDLRRILTDSECETIFTWCCLVAFVDDTFKAEEHVVLQEIARSLGIERHNARRLFHYAKQAHASGDAGAAGGRAGQRRPRGVVNERPEALAALGLDTHATDEQIRSRHRELVKKYHPDRHIHLGPIAAKEAEERFREVQAAYEILTGE